MQRIHKLKKKYGENVRYLCCGNTFNKRPGILRHFTTKIHKLYLQKMTEEYKKELPSDLSTSETFQKQSKEIRELKAEKAKLHDFCTKKCKEVEDKDIQIEQLLEIIQKYKNKELKRAARRRKMPEINLIDL